MRVVHVRTVLLERELVDEGFPGTYGRLIQIRDPIKVGWQVNAVPMHARGLTETIGHEDTNAISLQGLAGRARRGAVVTPALGARAGCELVLDLFGHQVKFLDPAFHLVGQCPAIETAHRQIALRVPLDFGRTRGGRSARHLHARHAGHVVAHGLSQRIAGGPSRQADATHTTHCSKLRRESISGLRAPT